MEPRPPRHEPRSAEAAARLASSARSTRGLVASLALARPRPLLLALLTSRGPGRCRPRRCRRRSTGRPARRSTTELARRLPEPRARLARAPRAPRSGCATSSRSTASTSTRTVGEDVAGLGRVELRNLAAVVAGHARRDDRRRCPSRQQRRERPGANDNASGTAALVELARALRGGRDDASPRARRSTRSSSSRPTAARTARSAPRGSPRPRRSRGASQPSSRSTGSPATRARGSSWPGSTGARPPPALVRTAERRVASETGARAAPAGRAAQLVSLALPFGYGEQAPLLGARGSPRCGSRRPRRRDARRAATSSRGSTTAPGTARACLGVAARLARRRASSSRARPPAPSSSATASCAAGRSSSLLLVARRCRSSAAALDLSRGAGAGGCRSLPAWRALRRRVGLWLVLVALLGLAAVAGALPTRAAAPAAAGPAAGRRTGRSASLVARRRRRRARLAPRAARGSSPACRATPEEELAAYAVAFVALLRRLRPRRRSSPRTAWSSSLPSLYAWLWLPQLRRAPGWVHRRRSSASASPARCWRSSSLAEQLDLGARRAALRGRRSLTTGVVPWACDARSFAALGARSRASSAAIARPVRQLRRRSASSGR